MHVHLFHALVLTGTLRRVPGSYRLLTHHHGARYVDDGKPLRDWLDRLCVRRFDGVVAVSRSTHDLLIQRYRYPEDRLWTIPNGWSGNPMPRDTTRNNRLITVANFRPEKCLDVLLRAFAQVLDLRPDAELTLVGDGPLRPALQAQAGELGISSQVRFPGAVSDIWPLLAKADLFVLPSRYETLGIAALEAMAAGLPVTASNVGGLKELIAPGVTGELVEPGDSEALAERLIAQLDAPETLSKMGRAAQERAASQRADGMVDAYEKLYAQIARSPL